MGVRDLSLGSVGDALAWLRSAMVAVTTTPSGSVERQARLDELASAVTRARVVLEAKPGKFGSELRLALHATEVLLARLRGPVASGAPGSPAPPSPSPEADDRRVHPRRRLLRGT